MRQDMQTKLKEDIFNFILYTYMYVCNFVFNFF